MTFTPAELAILFKPLFMWVFLGLVVYPIVWLLYRLIPDGTVKVVLFKVRDDAEATRHDRAVQLWAAVVGNALLWAWIGILASTGS
jgi:hypothetical protein